MYIVGQIYVVRVFIPAGDDTTMSYWSQPLGYFDTEDAARKWIEVNATKEEKERGALVIDVETLRSLTEGSVKLSTKTSNFKPLRKLKLKGFASEYS